MIYKYKKYIAIILLIMSITLFFVGIFTRNLNNKSLYIIFGEFLCITGMMFGLLDKKDTSPKRGFELVSENHKKTKSNRIILPKRSTKNSAAYDVFSSDSYIVQPNEIVKIWTDVKAYMQPDEFLMLTIRSSMGGKFVLLNQLGIIDSDYYDNDSNEGNIGVFLKNISSEPQVIEVGDRIGQCIFMKYLITDDDNTTNIRKGGFGSTN